MYGNVCWLLALPLCSCFSVSSVEFILVTASSNSLLCPWCFKNVCFLGPEVGFRQQRLLQNLTILSSVSRTHVVEGKNNNTFFKSICPFGEHLCNDSLEVLGFRACHFGLGACHSLFWSCELCLVPSMLNRSWAALWWAGAGLLWVAIRFGSQLSWLCFWVASLPYFGF